MISEFSARVKPTNKKAKGVVTVSLLSSLLCLVCYMLVDKYRGVIGLLIIGFIAVAVLFYTKYIAVEYFYDITFDGEHNPLFVIRQRIGNRYTTLCRVDLWSLKKVEKKTRAEMKSYRADSGVVKYVYSPTFMPEFVHLLTVRSRSERADIIIEAPDEFADYLRASAKEASDYKQISDEEDEY